MHQKSTRSGVHVGPRVADLSGFGELLRDNFVVGFYQVDKVVVLNIFFGEFKLAHESRVGFPKDGMAVSGHDFSRLKGVPDVVSDVFLGPGVSVDFLEVQNVVEALLVSQSVERSCKSVHAGRERQVGVGQGRSNQVRRVSGHVSSFVVGVDGDVKSHQLPELFVLESKHVGVVSTVVEAAVSVGNLGVVSKAIVEHDGCDSGNFCAEVESIFHGGFPVLALMDSTLVCFDELASGLAHEDSGGKLGHGMHGLGHGFNQLLLFSSELSALKHLLLEGGHLGLVREFTSEQEPQDSFGDGLSVLDSSRGVFLDLEEVHASVLDSVEVMEFGSLVEHAGEPSHSADD